MSKLRYQVLIVRRDGAHINAFESEDFDEAKAKWRKITDQWMESLKSEIAFELEEPIVIAFDPGLILEVSIAPVETNQKEDNPYKQSMSQNGLGNSLQTFTGGMDGLSDKGYR